MTSSTRSPRHYSAITQAIHWLTAVLVVVAFIYGPGGSEQRVYSAARDADRHLHETLGMCVLLLTTVRLAWRAIDKRPDPVVVSRWLGILAGMVQGALYVLLVLVPLTAIAGAWLEGHPLTFLGGVELAAPVPTNHSLGAVIAEIHSWLGDVILWTAGAHAAAAIYHHLVLKDVVLLSMLPAGASRRRVSERGRKR